MEIDILATLEEYFEKCPPLDQFLDTRLNEGNNNSESEWLIPRREHEWQTNKQNDTRRRSDPIEY